MQDTGPSALVVSRAYHLKQTKLLTMSGLQLNRIKGYIEQFYGEESHKCFLTSTKTEILTWWGGFRRPSTETCAGP